MKVQDLEKNLPSLGPEEKIEALREAVEKFESSGDTESYAHTMLLLGNAYRASGSYENATECFGKSSETFGKLGDLYGEAASLNNLGFANRATGNNNSALNNYEKALSIYRSLNDKDHEYIILLNIAKLYYSMNEYLEVIEYYEDALETKGGVRDSGILLDLGISYSKANDHVHALETLGEALSLAKESGDEKTEASTIEALAETYIGIGDTEKAGSIVKENTDILKKHPRSDPRVITIESNGDSVNYQNAAFLHPRVSKEIRTYLTSVVGYSQHIKDNTNLSSTEITDMMNDIEVSAFSINELILNLDFYEAILQGQAKPVYEKLDFTETASQALKICAASIKSKNLNLIFKASKNTIPISSDKKMVLHILKNLISNAVRFTPQGKNIYAYVSPDGEMARCEIIDEGNGFSEEEAESLLNGLLSKDRHHQAEDDSTEIGLMVAGSLTRILGGKLRCDSMLGKGSAFVLELPAV